MMRTSLGERPDRERYTRKLAAWRGNSADFPNFCGKIPLFARFNSAVPQPAELTCKRLISRR
jgi:hypothetical protein